VLLGLSPELAVASLKTTSSTSAHNSSGTSRVPSVHVGVDFSNGWHPARITKDGDHQTLEPSMEFGRGKGAWNQLW
jgi:hypothetical protein